MNRRQYLAAAAVVILLVGPTVGPALAAVQTVFVGSGTPIGTQSGLYVKPGSDSQLNLQDPWQASDAIEFRNVTFRGSDAEVTVDNFGDPNNAGQWTNLSSVTVQSSGRVFVDRAGSRQIGATGSVSELRVTDTDLSQGTDNVDLYATASGDWSLIVNSTGFSQGTGVVAENADTGEALDAAPVDSNGNVVLDQLTTTTATEINLRQGPSELRVYEESNPSQLVDGTTLRVRIFGETEVFEREVTNGRMDLTGIPSDERLTITVQDDADYSYRRISIPSTAQQEEVYLINETANPDVATVEFDIVDQTGGEFSTEQTQLLIDKAITKDFDGDGTEETQYQTVSGDTIGSSGSYTATLQNEERYRLRVINNDGNSRTLGSYAVQGDANPTLNIGEVDINSDNDLGYAVDVRTLLEDSNQDGTVEQFVQVRYEDRGQQTQELRYVLTNESSNTTITDEAISGPLGTHSATYQLAQNETASTYKLDWETTRVSENGSTVQHTGVQYAGDIPGIGGQLPIDDKWLSLIGFVSIVAVSGLIVIYDGSLAGLAATGWASLLTVLGIVAIPAPALGLAGAVSVIALVGRSR
jgi:hypothetical protein